MLALVFFNYSAASIFFNVSILFELLHIILITFYLCLEVEKLLCSRHDSQLDVIIIIIIRPTVTHSIALVIIKLNFGPQP